MLSRDRIERLAPDQASLSAALKLMKPANWPLLSRDGEGSLLWGECLGSGSTPYRIVASPADVGYKCTCPSRKFPCKHVLALLWTACDKPAAFAEASPPEWVADWQARRRPKAAGARPGPVEDGAPPASLDDALAGAADGEDRTVDPKAAARAEAQRRRLREEREAAVLTALDDLDRWIADQLGLGLAGFAQRASQGLRTLSTRLVDNKAQGLAARLDALAAEMFRVPEAMRGDFVLERLAALVLVCAAYRRQDRLSPALREDVRRAVGWTVRRDDLLADPDAPRATSRWIVAATRGEVQPDNLRRLETWLLDAAPAEGRPSVALLVDHVPVSAGASAPPFATGEVIAGELVYYPSAAPLRAQLAARLPGDAAAAWPGLPEGLGPGLAAYEAALASQPWIEAWPLTASGVALARLAPDRLAVTDGAGTVLPLAAAQTAALLPLLGLGPLAAVLVWDGRFATLLAADTPLGPWHEEA